MAARRGVANGQSSGRFKVLIAALLVLVGFAIGLVAGSRITSSSSRDRLDGETALADRGRRTPDRSPPPGAATPPAIAEPDLQPPAPTTPPTPPPASPPARAPEPPGDGGGGSGLRDLLLPVEGVDRDQLANNYDERRGRRRHEAIDILAPRNTPVRAVADGTVAKLFRSVAGGTTIYHFDPSGRYCYYYAHLERYARGLKEGDPLTRGQVIGYVGTSGNAPPDTPHLHFAIYRLGPDRRWWEGEPLNPFPALRNAE